MYVAFQKVCPEIAARETRTISLNSNGMGLPAGDYLFIEMFCDEPGCDCRRVFFSVFSSRCNQIQAVIAWGWEDPAFYQRWLRMDDPDMVSEMQGPVLNLGSPQSENAQALLELARDLLLADPAYVDRIKRHYAMFREKIRLRANKPNLAGPRSAKAGRKKGQLTKGLRRFFPDL